MSYSLHVRRLLWASMVVLCLAGIGAAAQTHKPLPMKPGVPATGANHRLILKDGTFQIVRKYEVVGDRVRYLSVERGEEWEELPESLVDWEATRKWERDHAETVRDDASPAMKEASDIDKEEEAARTEQASRMPEVAKGLELPDEDSVFILDIFHGTPELVELLPNQVGVDATTHHRLSALNPLAGKRASIELEGAHAKVHLHVNDPSIYLALDARDDAEQVVSHAMQVNTGGAKEVSNRKHGAHSPQSGFAIVRVDERKAVRIVGAVRLSPTGTVTQNEDVIPTKVEVLSGKHWLKLTPAQPLLIGEYALVEILSTSDISQTVWDFRVDPRTGDNLGSLGPIQKQ